MLSAGKPAELWFRRVRGYPSASLRPCACPRLWGRDTSRVAFLQPDPGEERELLLPAPVASSGRRGTPLRLIPPGPRPRPRSLGLRRAASVTCHRDRDPAQKPPPLARASPLREGGGSDDVFAPQPARARASPTRLAHAQRGPARGGGVTAGRRVM